MLFRWSSTHALLEWMAEYHKESRPKASEIQKEVDAFMKAFDEKTQKVSSFVYFLV
jgi:hypothetical protein